MLFGILISVFNMLSVYFATKNNRLTWLFGIFAAIGTSYIFKDIMQFQCIFQILTALFCLYSFIRWKSNNVENDNDIHISYVLSCMLLIFLFPLIFILLFENFNDNYIDLELTALSTLATILLYKKNALSWLIWMIVDMGFIVSSTLQNDNVITLVYIVLFVFAFYGFIRNFNLAYKNNNNKAFNDIEFLLNLK